jgi:hypothetical protein
MAVPAGDQVTRVTRDSERLQIVENPITESKQEENHPCLKRKARISLLTGIPA